MTSNLLIPRVSQVARLGDRVAEILEDEGVSIQEVLSVPEEERERYFKERE
jgi:hypothetical protein